MKSMATYVIDRDNLSLWSRKFFFELPQTSGRKIQVICQRPPAHCRRHSDYILSEFHTYLPNLEKNPDRDNGIKSVRFPPLNVYKH